MTADSGLDPVIHGPARLRVMVTLWGAPKLPDSPSIRMDFWKGEVIASTEKELLV